MARIGLLLLIGTLMIGCSFVSGTADTGNSTETEAETAPESPVAEVVEPTKQATLAPTDPPTVKARVFTNIKVLTLVETVLMQHDLNFS